MNLSKLIFWCGLLNYVDASVVKDSVKSADLETQAAHEKAEEKAKALTADEIRKKNKGYVLLWELCPSFKLSKDQIQELQDNENISVSTDYVVGSISLKQDQNHPALSWGKDSAPSLTGEEKKFFDDGAPLELASGEWDGQKLVYHYRWPGAGEKGKSVEIIANITVKTDSDKGKAIQEIFDHIKNDHEVHQKTHKSNVVYAAQQPASAPPPTNTTTIIHDVAPAPSTPPIYVSPGYPYGPYYGSPVVGGVIVGGWYGHHHHHW